MAGSMDFRTTLRHLNGAGEVTPREFVQYLIRKGVMKGMPAKNASQYLSRLFKMGLAYRRLDKRSYYGERPRKKPYRYRISQQGIRYLKWLKEQTKIDLPMTIAERLAELDKERDALEKQLFSRH